MNGLLEASVYSDEPILILFEGVDRYAFSMSDGGFFNIKELEDVVELLT